MTNPRVFITRIIPAAGLNLVQAACDVDLWPAELPPPRETLLTRVAGMDGLLCLLTDRVDAEVLDAAGPRLKVISNHAVGFDNIDVPAATARGIPVAAGRPRTNCARRSARPARARHPRCGRTSTPQRWA